MRASAYADRHAMLLNLADGVQCDGLRYADSVSSTKQKRAMLERMKRAKKEGVVFKDSTAHYAPGRPAGGGSQFKLKFTATASCIVAGTKANKRSVAIELLHGGKRVAVGNVTIPPNQLIPVAGEIVEVRYLYAYPGGSLYQPIFLGKRDDVSLSACSITQLKLKAGSEDGDEN
jgi:bifunctional non-homologous end joining protein LigD